MRKLTKMILCGAVASAMIIATATAPALAEDTKPAADKKAAPDVAQKNTTAADQKAKSATEKDAKPAPEQKSAPAAEQKAKPATEQKATPDVKQKATQLAPIQIQGEVEAEYKVTRSSTGTKTDTPVIETPVSVQTVTSEVISDRQYTRLKDVIENISNVWSEPSLGEGSRFVIRGFHQDRVYRDGLMSNGLNARFPTDYDIVTAESVEVIKGPASVLYGRIEPGGLINITTKKPQATSQHSLNLEGGSFNFKRVEADTTGSVTDGGGLLYRLVGAYQDSGTFKDFGMDNRLVLAPSLTWRPTSATDFRVSYERLDVKRQSDFGIPVIGNRPVELPRERSFGDPNDPKDQSLRSQIYTEINHRFSDAWALHHRFQFGRLENDGVIINPTPAFGEAIQADGRTMNRNVFWQSSDSDNYTTNLDIVGDIVVGATTHKIILGADYLQGRTHYYTGGDWKTADPALAIDIYNPTYGIDPSKFNEALQTYTNHSVFKDNVRGAYLQDQVKVGESVHLLLGGRYDWAETGRGNSTANESEADSKVPSRKDEAFSPRIAALYQFRPDLSTYVSWSQSFGQNNGLSSTGGTFAPQKGDQYEVGLKTELFEKRLLANVVLYHLTKTNLLTPDLSTADPNDSIAIGEQSSQGVEVDVSGQVTDSFKLIASYAYTDAKVTKDNSGMEGNRLNSVPDNAASLWGRYDLPFGLLVGLGGVYVGEKKGDIQNTFTLPSYTRLDGMAAYRFKMFGQSVAAQLNARNLLDTCYYESATSGLNVAPRLGVAVGAPRTFTASLKMEF